MLGQAAELPLHIAAGVPHNAALLSLTSPSAEQRTTRTYGLIAHQACQRFDIPVPFTAGWLISAIKWGGGRTESLPAPELLVEGGGAYRLAAELAYIAGTGEERHRLRAFVERHRPGICAEETAAQPGGLRRPVGAGRAGRPGPGMGAAPALLPAAAGGPGRHGGRRGTRRGGGPAAGLQGEPDRRRPDRWPRPARPVRTHLAPAQQQRAGLRVDGVVGGA
ncbi:hypothetical protein [Kitasatospora sp. MY 5-36]|uniref:hypothetical protein n=1 Tax=Kitasatospora sp. MY 5-36 TaxID=1678027 RepID=UPI00131C2BEE|nr:hypothetical protein [Kitasatospora sp. MY 5-36]